jgi:type I restriction enzyme R subunit
VHHWRYRPLLFGSGNKEQSEGLVQPGLVTLIREMLAPERFKDYVLSFIVLEDIGDGTVGITKKAAGYHLYHAVN